MLVPTQHASRHDKRGKGCLFLAGWFFVRHENCNPHSDVTMAHATLSSTVGLPHFSFGGRFPSKLRRDF